METVTENIKYRHAAHCYLADSDYGMRFAKACHLDLEKVISLSAMTHAERMENTKN